MDLVSIILPYYKKKNFILKTINSVTSQKFKNFELIIIYDDTDKSDLKYLTEICNNDKRIKILINKTNQGAGISRNKGLRVAKGNYIAFIDADDIWHPNKIYFQLNFMKKNKFNITHTSYYVTNSKSQIIGKRIANNLTYYDLVKSCDIGLSTVILKKKILKKKFFANLKTKEDYVLWLRLAKKGHKFYGLNKFFTRWMSLNNSLSSSTIQKLFDGYKVYRIHLKKSVFLSFYHLFILSFNFLKK